ncbi:MAG TPA: EAL domain-containing protein [Devosia sp.]|nr:EAL domain-containing protein [Devosia sp.]
MKRLRSNSNILMLIAAILAFVPVFMVGYFLDGFVRGREGALIQRSINGLTEDVQASIYEGIDVINAAVADSNSVCTPNFLNTLRLKMQMGLYVRQVAVESVQGVPYCDAVGGMVPYEVVSDELSIPGRSATLAAVLMPGADVPMFRVTQMIDRNRRMQAFVNFSQIITAGRLPSEIRAASMLRISFTDDTELVSIGDPSTFTASSSEGEYLIANAFAGDVPVRIEVALPFETARAGYADIYLVLILAACLLSGTVLFIFLQLARNANLPDFDLEHAIMQGAICPYYQPVIDLSTGRVSGCEVLARWQKTSGKTISPGAFIEYAEVTGLAIPMTIRLMETVAHELGDLCLSNPELKISINLFEGHFRDGAIVEDVQAIFGGSGISYRQLVFEITERFPLENDEQTISVINGLHALGCRLALDDVGTGHSNLSFVQTLGVDIIKIDRIFVSAVTDKTEAAPVLDGLIAMAQNLGADVVAEGVETEEQAMYLRAKGVRNVQGFLFAEALPVEKYVRIVGALNQFGENSANESRKAA